MPYAKGDKIVPDFRVVERLGGGGFGEVYKVQNFKTGSYFALKTLREEHLGNEELKKAFIDEVIMWLQLGEHKNIARAIQRFTLEGRDFLLVELVDGMQLDDLREEEDEERLSLWQALDVGIQFCDAMIYCRSRVDKFVHRDIKPNNIMYTRKRTLKVIDFGLAECAGWQTIMSEKQAGTPPYMAPEVLAKGRPTVKSDLYSFGITWGVLLTGEAAISLKTNGEEILRKKGVPKKAIEIFKECVNRRGYSNFKELKIALLSLKEDIASEKIPVSEDRICAECEYVPCTSGIVKCPLCHGPLISWRKMVEFVHIPEGRFIKGCSRDMALRFVKGTGIPEENINVLQEYRYEKVLMEGYAISKYPITNREYYEFAKDTGYPFPDHWAPDDPPFPLRLSSHPVVNISFRDAEAFCKWMGEKRGINVRLPSPLEWEKAARGTDGRLYPWGDRFESDRCWGAETPEEGWEGIRTTPVGDFPYGNSPFGLEDMGGNVWEWIESFDPYKELRGGSWKYPAKVAALSFLSLISAAPEHKDVDFGFRFVMEFQPGDPKEDLLVRGYRLSFVPGLRGFIKGCPSESEMVVAEWLSDYGYNARAYLEECKPGKIDIRPFYMLTHPVTNLQYLKFAKDTDHPLPAHWTQGNLPFPKEKEQHPVCGISYEDAREFCRWLENRLGITVRLPRAEEWELAARGEDGYLYPWGNEFAPYRCNSLEYPHTVSVSSFFKGASPYGLFHVCGNVYEIIKDRKSQKIEVRGGSWKSSCKLHGVTFLPAHITGKYKENDIGFRVVKGSEQRRRSLRDLVSEEDE